MKWVFKAVAQGGVSLLPDNQRWNYVFQKYVTKTVFPTKKRLSKRFLWCANHLAGYEQFSTVGKVPRSVLELGTGWVPTVPIGLYLCGIEQIYTIDIHDLKRAEIVTATLSLICSFSLDELSALLPKLNPDRFEALKSCVAQGLAHDQLFEKLNIHFITGDARQTQFDDHSLDFFISNTTLEHVPRDTILGIFKEFGRIIAPKGLMCHFIDATDHYAHFDSSISSYHFLQHSDLVWRLVNNDLFYQNRLRISDYRELHRASGFKILGELNNTLHTTELKGIKPAKRFQHYSADDLALTSSWMVSTPFD